MKRRRVWRVLGAVAVALLVAAALAAGTFWWIRMQRTRADLVLRGRIITLDEAMPDAQALAARGGRIIAIGSDDDVDRHVGWWTRTIELGDNVAYPGFIEGHGHFAALGESLLGVDVSGATSWDEVVQRVAEAVAAAKPGAWIIGRGWHQDKWTTPPVPNIEGFPLHASLDEVSPDNPVVLTHASGHASFVNARAMAVSQITRDTVAPDGGEILKDGSGSPTGLLRETASRLVRQGAGEPDLTDEEQGARMRQILQLADREARANGITSFQDAGTTLDLLEQMKRMIDAGQLKTRMWAMLRVGDGPLEMDLAREKLLGYGDHRLTVRAVKWTLDGALGSRGAWLLAPYADRPESVGLPRSLATLRALAAAADQHGFQLAVHAIGDRANREVLDVYEQTFSTARPGAGGRRWRIEHAQHLAPDDIPRFAKLGVIASMQPVHATSDAVFVPARLGEDRARQGAYVWQSLMRSGAIVTSGTDVPVESINPLANFHAAVTRRTAAGDAFHADQRMTRLEALRAYTVQNAYAAFEEDLKGTLAVDKLADITVLTADILAIPDDQITATRVAYTIVGGEVVYESDVR